jgi:hypothetical protein
MLECPFVFKSLDCVDGWMATQVAIDANPIPLLRIIIAERKGKKNADAGWMHPTKAFTGWFLN